MPVSPIESNIGLVAQGKQAALGTKLASNAAGLRRLRVRDGGLKPVRELGSEPYLDGQAFNDATPYLVRTGGEVGDLTIQAQIETGGFLFAQLIGADVVTGAGPDYTHTISSSNLSGAYQTIYQSSGQGQLVNQAFWDALISKLTWRVGTDQMVAHVTESIRAMTSGSWSTSTPTAADAGTDPFLWPEVSGAAQIDAVAFAEISGETLEVDRKLEDYMGDSIAPCAFVPTQGEIRRSVATIVSNNTLPIIKSLLYNTATPTDGQVQNAAIKHIALTTKYTRTATRSIEIQTPKVLVEPDDLDLSATPDGGPKALVLGGRCRPNGGTPALTVIAKTADSAAYV